MLISKLDGICVEIHKNLLHPLLISFYQHLCVIILSWRFIKSNEPCLDIDCFHHYLVFEWIKDFLKGWLNVKYSNILHKVGVFFQKYGIIKDIMYEKVNELDWWSDLLLTLGHWVVYQYKVIMHSLNFNRVVNFVL